jgi:DNA-binding transcriptional ArsR family regulator
MTTFTPYKAIADDTRRHILDMLRAEPLTAGAIAKQFERRGRSQAKLSRPAVSKHLSILRRSKLVIAHREGRERIYALNAEPLSQVNNWVKQYEAFWDKQLQSFKEFVESEEAQEKTNARKG